MKRCEISVLTNFNGQKKVHKYMAIKNDSVIKYIDLEKNRICLNLEKNILERENRDYKFIIDFDNNNIEIYIKKLKNKMDKKIKTLMIDKNNNSYLVKYFLTDEKEVNEYSIKY